MTWRRSSATAGRSCTVCSVPVCSRTARARRRSSSPLWQPSDPRIGSHASALKAWLRTSVVSPRTVQRARKRLRERGWWIPKDRGGGHGRAAVDYLAWPLTTTDRDVEGGGKELRQPENLLRQPADLLRQPGPLTTTDRDAPTKYEVQEEEEGETSSSETLVSPSSPPRLEGESADEWLRRMERMKNLAAATDASSEAFPGSRVVSDGA